MEGRLPRGHGAPVPNPALWNGRSAPTGAMHALLLEDEKQTLVERLRACAAAQDARWSSAPRAQELQEQGPTYRADSVERPVAFQRQQLQRAPLERTGQLIGGGLPQPVPAPRGSLNLLSAVAGRKQLLGAATAATYGVVGDSATNAAAVMKQERLPMQGTLEERRQRHQQLQAAALHGGPAAALGLVAGRGELPLPSALVAQERLGRPPQLGRAQAGPPGAGSQDKMLEGRLFHPGLSQLPQFHGGNHLRPDLGAMDQTCSHVHGARGFSAAEPQSKRPRISEQKTPGNGALDNAVAKFLNTVVRRVPEIRADLDDIFPFGGDASLLKGKFHQVADAVLPRLEAILQRNLNAGERYSHDLHDRATRCIIIIRLELDKDSAGPSPAAPDRRAGSLETGIPRHAEAGTASSAARPRRAGGDRIKAAAAWSAAPAEHRKEPHGEPKGNPSVAGTAESQVPLVGTSPGRARLGLTVPTPGSLTPYAHVTYCLPMSRGAPSGLFHPAEDLNTNQQRAHQSGAIENIANPMICPPMPDGLHSGVVPPPEELSRTHQTPHQAGEIINIANPMIYHPMSGGLRSGFVRPPQDLSTAHQTAQLTSQQAGANHIIAHFMNYHSMPDAMPGVLPSGLCHPPGDLSMTQPMSQQSVAINNNANPLKLYSMPGRDPLRFYPHPEDLNTAQQTTQQMIQQARVIDNIAVKKPRIISKEASPKPKEPSRELSATASERYAKKKVKEAHERKTAEDEMGMPPVVHRPPSENTAT